MRQNDETLQLMYFQAQNLDLNTLLTLAVMFSMTSEELILKGAENSLCDGLLIYVIVSGLD